jgi:hypothetical protein
MHKKSTILLTGVVFVVLGLYIPGVVHAAGSYVAGSTGYDISWPNCSAALPLDKPWGVVGVTGGLNFRPNKCLVDETRWFGNLSLYANTGYPGAVAAQRYGNSPRHCQSQDESCLAYNYGYNAGAYAVQYAASKNIHAAMWWLDVETENSWGDDVLLNRASIQGEYDAIKHYTVIATIGAYSYPGQWDRITGSWRPGWPAWAATGSTERADALAFCHDHDFTGGDTWLAQYTPKLDQNYACQ